MSNHIIKNCFCGEIRKVSMFLAVKMPYLEL